MSNVAAFKSDIVPSATTQKMYELVLEIRTATNPEMCPSMSWIEHSVILTGTDGRTAAFPRDLGIDGLHSMLLIMNASKPSNLAILSYSDLRAMIATRMRIIHVSLEAGTPNHLQRFEAMAINPKECALIFTFTTNESSGSRNRINLGNYTKWLSPLPLPTVQFHFFFADDDKAPEISLVSE